MRRTSPSTRNSVELQPPRALHPAREQRGEIVGEPTKRRHRRLADATIGLAKRRSTQKSGAAKRGEIASRVAPLSASSRAIVSAPKRAAIGARGLSARSPIAPQARAREVGARPGSIPSAATGMS